MAYVRFTQDDSEVYVYVEDRVFTCQHLEPGEPAFRSDNATELLAHLERYRAAGHVVPAWVFRSIRLDVAVAVGDSTFAAVGETVALRDELPSPSERPAGEPVVD